jgi:hypothetical protein
LSGGFVLHACCVDETSSDESENEDSLLGRNDWGGESSLSIASRAAVPALVGEELEDDDAEDPTVMIGGGSSTEVSGGNRCLGAIAFRSVRVRRPCSQQQ